MIPKSVLNVKVTSYFGHFGNPEQVSLEYRNNHRHKIGGYPQSISTLWHRVLMSIYLILVLLSSYFYYTYLLNLIIACVRIVHWNQVPFQVKGKQHIAKYRTNAGDISRRRNPLFSRFVYKIWTYLFLTRVTQHPKLKTPIIYVMQGFNSRQQPHLMR